MFHTPWTSALEVATIELRNYDDSEEPIMMQNVSGLFRHVRQLVAILLSLIVDAMCYLGALPASEPYSGSGVTLTLYSQFAGHKIRKTP